MQHISESERLIRRLYEITSSYQEGFSAQLRELLALGRERLGLDMGIVSRVDGQRYLVVESSGPESRPAPGVEFALTDTYCAVTLAADGPQGFHHVGQSEHKAHPCYLGTGLEAYLGVPLRTREGVFGTLNFSSSAPKNQPFQAIDVDAVQLMAQWIAGELERRHLADQVKAIHGLVPICASCKSIRSELGDWQALEHYFKEHAELLFTHGICPECAKAFSDEPKQSQGRG